MDRIGKLMQGNRNITLSHDDALIENIVRRCKEVASGARNVDHILSNTLPPKMPKQPLARMGTDEQTRGIRVERAVKNLPSSFCTEKPAPLRVVA